MTYFTLRHLNIAAYSLAALAVQTDKSLEAVFNDSDLLDRRRHIVEYQLILLGEFSEELVLDILTVRPSHCLVRGKAKLQRPSAADDDESWD